MPGELEKKQHHIHSFHNPLYKYSSYDPKQTEADELLVEIQWQWLLDWFWSFRMNYGLKLWPQTMAFRSTRATRQSVYFM